MVNFAQLINQSPPWRHSFFAALTITTMLILGYYYGTFDQSIHIPFLKKYADPTLFPNDPFIELRHQHYSYFWFMFLPIFLTTGETGLQITLFIGHVGMTYLTFWAFWLLAKTLCPNPLAAMFGVVALTMPHFGFTGLPLIEWSLLNRTFALPFVILALVLHLRGRTFWALALLGVLFNFHILSVLYVLPMILLDSVLRWKQVGVGRGVAGLMVLGLGALPVLIWKMSGPSIHFNVQPEWFHIISSGMFAHMFFMVAPYPYILLLTFCGLATLGLYLIARQAHPTWPHQAALTNFILASLLVMVGQNLLMLTYPITLIAQMQLMRIGIYITIFGYLSFAAHLAQEWENNTMPPLDFGLLAAATMMPSPVVPLTVWAVQQWVRPLYWQRFLVGTVLVVLTGLSFGLPMMYNVWQPTIVVFPSRTAWVDIQLKAKALSPKEALFITPPDITWLYIPDWRVFAERSTVVTLSELLEMAIVPDNMASWRARMADLAPGTVEQFNGNFYDNQVAVRAAFYHLTTADFTRLAAKYGATYLVVEQPHRYDFPILYENAEFVLYSNPAKFPPQKSDVFKTSDFYGGIKQVAAPLTATVQLWARDNAPLTALIDGNQISLKITLLQAVTTPTPIEFSLINANTSVAHCTIMAGQTACQTAAFPALGWAWDSHKTRQTQGVIQAQSAGQTLGVSEAFTITPRPVVMVFGFNSTWDKTWLNYLGADGYLASIGVHGYAIGDGQLPGEMNTGSMFMPTARTNSIAQNAHILGEYIRQVQQATQAEQVDVLVHSMGGIITRYYLDRVMTERNVAQLIILGSPMGGSACATLPASLGLMLPASLELQPSYMEELFNPQITRRRGVPFHALAGTKLFKAVQSPCTTVPSDLLVSMDSVKAIDMPVQEIPLLHIDLNAAPEVFTEFVQGLLQTPPGDFWQVTDPPAVPAPAALQFSRVYTGHVQPGTVQSVTINIDPHVTVANFALYDTSRSLTTTVTGASGKLLALNAITNGEIRITDPASMLYLGYGFAKPKAGQWIVALHPTADTPAQGADFAITAQFSGGAMLQANLDKWVAPVNEPLTLKATLTISGEAMPITQAEMRLRQPDGSVQTYPVTLQGNQATLTFAPTQSGLHGVELSVKAQTATGQGIDRAAFLIFETEPAPAEVNQNRLIVGLILVICLGAAGLLWRWRANRKKRLAGG